MSFFSTDKTVADLVLKAFSRSQAIIEFKPDGTILSANENFCRAVGYAASEIIGRHHAIFVSETERESAEYKAFWAKLAKGEFATGRYLRIAKSGAPIFIEASYNPILDRRGRVLKVVKIASDITETRIRSIEADAKLDAIGRAQAVIEFTVDGTILSANENFLKTLGYELSEIVGQHHRMFCEPDYVRSPSYADFWRRLGEGEFFSAEYKRVGKGGREVFVQASYNPIFDLEGKVSKIVKYATDVTPRVRAVAEIGDGLERLADGDLSLRLTRPFGSELDTLRDNFNRSLETLSAALGQVQEAASVIDGATAEIRVASDDLARRTEQQAAAVEQTAATTEELTRAVATTAERARDAGDVVDSAHRQAKDSEVVVRDAVSAMDAIAASSKEIGRIIDMIEEIAFQTNLLALNAGIEAARAGEAGRGFAVVAQEVRELAQRSSNAAKTIKDLIERSGNQVRNGVDLVGKAGNALGLIATGITSLQTNIQTIVEASQSQHMGLAEINVAIGAIDHGTQQNATMVEEASAACHNLVGQSNELSELLGRFRLVEAERRAPSRHWAETSLAA
ncbi:methyl-accepting chemotaxis sensory transducer with Pas/Pac sensor [Fulvimarina manganoxydans]|uniref:Methyl-accepting chemotaxis sensory transducer with Pas/Pac sensor n=1 Tax=Fulvimarina manganoxydans TaxID=937218 RepID=A0A1W2E962_9HYPH|nr:methyl-accepting chemotaxis protein [Fulvimarina manganoxydans]SMD05962.1 methyl-accepting chemotaxis sensory transducer with Pas/Pac sensor [Fulvimarina manganoxydans]